MKILGGGRAIRHAEVDRRRHLEEALGPGAGVVRPLALEAVGQQEHERRSQSPLGARREDEFVDHDLSGIDEIPVLRFPDHQPARLLHVVAVFKGQSRIFAERAVAHLEGRFRPGQSLQRGEGLIGIHIIEDGVPLAESPALHVLAREANGDAVFEDRSQRQLFGHRPVDGLLVNIVQRPPPSVPGAFELAVERETLGHSQKAPIQLPQPLDGDRRPGVARRARRRRLGHRLDQLAFGFE